MARAATKPAPGIELPRTPQVGDLVRVKESIRARMMVDAKTAGFTFDPEAAREVVRTDQFCPGGGVRLFIEGAPFAFSSRDVDLAWPDGPQGEQRRRKFRALGRRA